MITKETRVFVAGHRGLVGSALCRQLRNRGYRNIIVRGREDVDLTDAAAVERLFREEGPECVVLAAAKVGGIHANNTYRAEFVYQNLMIQNHVIHQAWRHGVERLLFLGSSCIYPRDCPQPIREEYLLTGPLEETNRPYAIAKIAGIEMCRAYNAQYGTRYTTVMPTNLYGPGDNFDLESSHVLPALIARANLSRERGDERLAVWGSGRPMREFLHVDDLAAACVFLLESEDCPDMANIGSGQEITIRDLAEMVCDVVGFTGRLDFDTNMPDGTPRKRLETSCMDSLGWKAAISLREGIESTNAWYLENRRTV